jgi:hypothetical protein
VPVLLPPPPPPPPPPRRAAASRSQAPAPPPALQVLTSVVASPVRAGITALEAMMMQSAMTAAKQTSQISNILKLCTSLAEDSDSSDDEDEAETFTLDPETLAKVKASAYEKLAKDKGKTVEELKAEAKEMSVSAHQPRPAPIRELSPSLLSLTPFARGDAARPCR